jgi:simple sugar transport system permease protein
VHLVRIGAVIAGSAIMALGGAFLTMSAFNAFFFEMTGGRGWICIALTCFASWRPGKALLGAVLFGAFDAFQLRLQHEVAGVVPSQVFLMLPYLCRSQRSASSPAARITREPS